MSSPLLYSQSVLEPPNPAFMPNSPRGGILLNPQRPSVSNPLPISPPSASDNYYLSPNHSVSSRKYAYTLPTYPRSAEVSATSRSNSSSGSSSDERHHSRSDSRKIRFAPLPDPRRSSSVPPSDRVQPGFSLTVPALEDPHGMDPSSFDESRTPPIMDDFTQNTIYRLDCRGSDKPTKKSGSWGATKKLFKPLLQLPKSSSKSGEDPGGSGLFRSSSYESNHSWLGECENMGRRASMGAEPSCVLVPRVVPLTVTISEPGIRRGTGSTKMLNGRTYGSKRRDHSPSVPVEPEFVEWGYGGMGSVKGGSGMWNKVQSANHIAQAEGEDDFDGSGMGWVRKRREARAAREREEAERRRNGSGDSQEASTPSPAPSTASSDDLDTIAPVFTVTSPEHTYTAVSIPAPPPHRPRLHSASTPTQSRTSSEHKRNSNTSTPMLSRTSTMDGSNHAQALATETSLREGMLSKLRREEARKGQMEDDDDEDDDDDDDSDTAEEDKADEDEASSQTEEDEELQEEQKRKTAECAGVEKISRHKDSQAVAC